MIRLPYDGERVRLAGRRSYVASMYGTLTPILLLAGISAKSTPAGEKGA